MTLLFEIFDRGRRLTDFLVRGAYVTGAESVPVAGRVSFEGGLLRVDSYAEPAEDEEEGGGADRAFGVALLWDTGDAGTYLLETTRLPPREQPYILNVELARHRLMRLVHKQEDWNLWDGPAAVPNAVEPLRKNREAQQLLAEAMGLLHNPAEAARVADEALERAIEASEELSLLQADMSLARRRAGPGGTRIMLGVRADPAIRNAKYRGTLARFFDYSIVPVSWRQLQPEEDRFETEAADSTIEFLARNRVPIIAGPLVDLSEGEVPEWLFIYENEFEAIRDLAFDYVRSVVTRYRRVVRVWNVVAGLHAGNGFALSFEQMIELTRLLVGQVKSVNPQAKTLVTIRMPYGEYLAQAGSGGMPGVPPQLYAEMVAQSGVDCDGFGIEIETGMPRRGLFCRDLFQVSAMLERFASLGKPVFVTAVACPDRGTAAGGANPAEGGRWHADWTPERQAKWLRAIYRVALSKPFVENVAWADLSDFESSATTLPGSGLLDDMLRPKPAFEALQDIRKNLRPPQPAGQAAAAPTTVPAVPAADTPSDTPQLAPDAPIRPAGR